MFMKIRRFEHKMAYNWEGSLLQVLGIRFESRQFHILNVLTIFVISDNRFSNISLLRKGPDFE